MKKILALLLICVSIMSVYYMTNRRTQPGGGSYNEKISQELIRFHVIANSDSEADQSVKLEIRDAVLSKIGPDLEKMNSRGNAISYLKDNISTVTDIANNILKENAMGYTAVSMVGQYDFPVKSYNTVTLPAGEYTALRVVLGNGDGKNWWCVMFPPLCFIDITQGLTDETTDQQLNRVMTTKEVDSITTVMEKGATIANAKTTDSMEDTNTQVSSSAALESNQTDSVEFRFKTVEIIKSFINKIKSK